MSENTPAAVNELAKKLLARLAELNVLVLGGYFGQAKYCAGVFVDNAAEAVKLGISLGEGDWGEIDYDHGYGKRPVIVFRDARVRQGFSPTVA